VSDGTGVAEALLGLPGFRVLEVVETTVELVVRIETTATLMGCAGCGTRAEVHDRVEVAIRDLPCFGRPARLIWRKRRWRCREPRCERKTWTETSQHVDAQVVLTRRAGAEAWSRHRWRSPLAMRGPVLDRRRSSDATGTGLPRSDDQSGRRARRRGWPHLGRCQDTQRAGLPEPPSRPVALQPPAPLAPRRAAHRQFWPLTVPVGGTRRSRGRYPVRSLRH
jgi:hypothetical protein